MDRLHGHSITYRIAAGPNEGRKVFTLQTLPPTDEPAAGALAKHAGFSLHAGVAAEAHQRDKPERLVRYITRPALCEQRLSLTEHGTIRYQLKTPYRDGTTHVFFEPLDFVARLAALVPHPGVHLTRYHGVFAPHHHQRPDITRAQRGKGKRADATEAKTPAEQRAAMTWAQRLKRVFHIDIQTCSRCQGRLKIISCIDDPAVIQKILTHLAATATAADPSLRPLAPAPPAQTRRETSPCRERMLAQARRRQEAARRGHEQRTATASSARVRPRHGASFRWHHAPMRAAVGGNIKERRGGGRGVSFRKRGFILRILQLHRDSVRDRRQLVGRKYNPRSAGRPNKKRAELIAPALGYP